jgi:hypothetical protein
MISDTSQTEWRALVERLLKAEMSKRGIRYQELSDRLHSIGVKQSSDNLRNKINKGILGADLMLQIMYVLNIKVINRELMEDIGEDLHIFQRDDY